MPNFLYNAIRKNHQTMVDSGYVMRCYDNCRERFTIFHVLAYIMYTESLLAFDVLEERGIMKHNVKKHRTACEQEWAKYQKTMKSDMKDSAWYLVQDYCMSAHSSLEKELQTLRLCFHNHVLKQKIQYDDALAQLSVAIKIADWWESLWVKYFDTFKKLCGFSFVANFAYADMHTFIFHLRQIALHTMPNNTTIDYTKDVSCVNAMNVLEYKIASDDFLDNAALFALNQSETYRPQYQKMVDENNAKKERAQINLLSTKFNKVGKLKKKKEK